MKLFRHRTRQATEESRRLYARFEIAYTIVDFMAAVCFIVGSILFFFDAQEIPATWFFLIGSLLFAAKPTLRLIREIKLYQMGDMCDLAKRVED